eukprot:5290902-Pyramimonas_sp.AAC.1
MPPEQFRCGPSGCQLCSPGEDTTWAVQMCGLSGCPSGGCHTHWANHKRTARLIVPGVPQSDPAMQPNRMLLRLLSLQDKCDASTQARALAELDQWAAASDCFRRAQGLDPQNEVLIILLRTVVLVILLRTVCTSHPTAYRLY